MSTISQKYNRIYGLEHAYQNSSLHLNIVFGKEKHKSYLALGLEGPARIWVWVR
jgi:hypothetical protein